MYLFLIALIVLSAGCLAVSGYFALTDWGIQESRPNVLFASCCCAFLTFSLLVFAVPFFDGPDLLAILFGVTDREDLGTTATLISLGSLVAGLAAPFSRVRAGYTQPIPGLVVCLFWYFTGGFTAIP